MWCTGDSDEEVEEGGSVTAEPLKVALRCSRRETRRHCREEKGGKCCS